MIMIKIKSNNKIKSHLETLLCLCLFLYGHQLAVEGLLEAPAKPGNLEGRWGISLWDSRTLSPAMDVHILMTTPAAPWECWHSFLHTSLPSCLGLKKLKGRRLLEILWSKGQLPTHGLQEYGEHPWELGQIEKWV